MDEYSPECVKKYVDDGLFAQLMVQQEEIAMNRKLLITAVATAMCAPALAAFDDQGMEYISASEGLSGSMRINIFKDSDKDNSGIESGIDSLRIYYTGSADLGGGLRSTYYWELRENSDDGPEGNVHTEAFDLGLSGPFGTFSVGRLGGVAPRLVPGGSLDAAVSSEHANYSPDPGPNGLRYESNDINGFRFGLSGQLQDRAGADSNLDSFNAAVGYVHPIGLQLGAGFESSACWVEQLSNGCDQVSALDRRIAVEEGIELTSQQRMVASELFPTPKLGDRSGFRFGARYGQDNWLLAYEFRSHGNFDGNLGESGYGTIIGDFPATAAGRAAYDTAAAAADPVADPAPATLAREDGDYDFLDGTSYQVHRIAAQVKLDKLTFSANFSVEETEVTDDFTIGVDEIAYTQKRKFGRDKIGLDVSYALGSKSSLILGWGSTESEVGADEIAANEIDQAVKTEKVAETLLRYRVDF